MDAQAHIRPATLEDLPHCYRIVFEAAEGDRPGAVGRMPVPSALQHELRTGEFLVAEIDGEVVGFAVALPRGGITHLAENFVMKKHRGRGIGHALVEQVFEGAAVRTVLGSADPRALTLYIHRGMRPEWPAFWLRAEVGRIRAMRTKVEVEEGAPGDPEFLRWDKAVFGRERKQDHVYWRKQRAARPLWFRSRTGKVGYGYVQWRSDDTPSYPVALTLGPIGAANPDDAAQCILAAAQWARTRGDILRMVVPGPSPALPRLLDSGFRITYSETFLCSSAKRPFDARCYIPSGSELL